MKLSDFRGEDAIEVLADLIEPVSEIISDKEVLALLKGNNRLKAVSVALKKHKRAVLTILAITDGEDVATYRPTVAALPKKVLEVLNDPDIVSLFSSQSQDEKTSSGSATVNSEADERT